MLQFLAEAGAGAAGYSSFSMIPMLLIMVAVFYFVGIRPESKRKKEAEQMRANMKTGDKVVTIGGIHGTVVAIKDDKFVIETGADQVRIELSMWALSSNITATEAAAEEKKKAAEAKAKAKAAKKAAKENKNNR